jgi:ABC-2 type transport system permease protein
MKSNITTLLKKDLLLFSRDRFYFLITVVGILMYFVIYFIMPQTMNEQMKMALYAPGIPGLVNIDPSLAEGQGIDLKLFDSGDQVKKAVAKNEFPSGIVLPTDFLTSVQAGERPPITVYFSAAAPEELRTAVTTMINEIASQAAGQKTVLQLQTEILGRDMSGSQIPWRDRLIPALVIFILGTEVMSLASLIATELEQKTIRALLVTPLRLNDLLTAKAILGITMAFVQVVLFVAIVGGMTHQTFAMLAVLLVGSVLVTGTGFLIASLARDLMGVTAWGMIAMIIFVIPAIGGLIPGLLAGWAKFIPSYHLTDAITQLVNYRTGIGAISSNLIIMLGWSAVFATIGVITLRRRYSWASAS